MQQYPIVQVAAKKGLAIEVIFTDKGILCKTLQSTIPLGLLYCLLTFVFCILISSQETVPAFYTLLEGFFVML